MAIVSPELMKKWGIKQLNEYDFLIKSKENVRTLRVPTLRVIKNDKINDKTDISNSEITIRSGRGLNPEWVKEQFKNEGCELVNEYKGCESELIYKYKGHPFSITWHRWNKGERPHKCDEDEIKIVENPKENGVSIYCIRNVPTNE